MIGFFAEDLPAARNFRLAESLIEGV